MSLDPNFKILVVDDMDTMRKIIRNMLKIMDCEEVYEADDGQTAWEMIEQACESGNPFDFIITDWNMPRMNGMTLLKKLKADERFQDLPLLLVTGESEQGKIVSAVKEGVSNFIIKPFDIDIFQTKIDSIFK